MDGFGDVIQEVSPEKGAISYWYDADGDLTKTVDANSTETDYTYDALNRRLTKTWPKGSYENIAYTYDGTTGGNKGVGRLTSVTDVCCMTTFTYDAQGRVTRIRVRLENQAWVVRRRRLPPMATRIMACDTSMRSS